MHLGVNSMPMMSGKGMSMSGANPVLMNGMPMMRPSMGMPPGIISNCLNDREILSAFKFKLLFQKKIFLFV